MAVLESEFVRLVAVPEVGARVISLVDRRTGREWLVQGMLPADDVAGGASARAWAAEDAVFGGAEAFGWDGSDRRPCQRREGEVVVVAVEVAVAPAGVARPTGRPAPSRHYGPPISSAPGSPRSVWG